MAGLSLQCATCKAQFRSVEEAQEHAELTKHADFEESTEPVRVFYCCCFVFFPPAFSCPFWWPICCREHGGDPSLRTFGFVFSLLSSAAYQVCRSTLLKSFWMDPLSKETYFCSGFVVWLTLFWSWRRQQQPYRYFSHRQQTVKCFFNSSHCSFLFARSSLTCNAQLDSRRWLLQRIYNLNFFPASISVSEST